MGEAGCRCLLVMTRPVERSGGPLVAECRPESQTISAQTCRTEGMQWGRCPSGFWRQLAGLLVVGVLVATGCGGGSGEVSEPATTTQAPATTTQAPATTTQAPATTRGSASTTTAATTSTLPTVSTVEIELSDASAEVWRPKCTSRSVVSSRSAR